MDKTNNFLAYLLHKILDIKSFMPDIKYKNEGLRMSCHKNIFLPLS